MDDNNTKDLISIVDLESSKTNSFKHCKASFTNFFSCVDYNRLSAAQTEVLGQFIVVLHSYWGQGTLPLQVPDIKAVLELCAKVGRRHFLEYDRELNLV